MDASQLIMDFRLGACFNACNIVAHGVEARFGGVNLDYIDEHFLAPFQLLLPIFTLRFTIFKNHWLRINSLVN